jgi:CRP/FNR family transcriptional regulator, cyclic AMP receptor protein
MGPTVGNRPRSAPDKRALLQANPFFKNLDAAILDRLVSHAIIRKVRKGSVLFRKDDAGSTLYAVCEGGVRISVPSSQGQDAIFNIVTRGEIFGEIALLDGGNRTADAVAIEDSEIMLIERRDFVAVLRAHPEMAINLIEILCSRLRRTSEQVEDIVFLDVPGRLAKALLQLHRRGAANPTDGIRITQRELSQMIGVSRESVNKQLRSWERRKWLKIERGGVRIVAPAALSGLVSENADEASAHAPS